LFQFLRDYIHREVTKAEETQRRKFGDVLTIGLEQEFFLLNEKKEPLTHSEGQSFFHFLISNTNWRTYEKETSEIFGEYISRLSRETENGYFALKYDHHPHLFEVAFPVYKNLHDLNDAVKSFFSEIEKASHALNFSLSKSPFLEGKAPESELEEFKGLREYRKHILSNSGSAIAPENYNYAASIAATQVHIGGLSWHSDSNLINSLYHYEPAFTLVTHHLSGSPLSLQSFLKKRWSGFLTVFKDNPLAGIPKISHWSPETWQEALLNAPLAGTKEDPWLGKTLATVDATIITGFEASPKTTFKLIRDLEIIRPKLFGTLEFRADPALQSAELVLTVAALRLGLCEYLKRRNELHTSLDSVRERWNSLLQGAPSPEIKSLKDDLIRKAYQGLLFRKRGEEFYIESLYAALDSPGIEVAS